MADEKSDSKDAGEAEESAKNGTKKCGFLTKTPVIVGGAMAVEAVALFVGFKFFAGGPDAAAAAVEAQLDGHSAEVQYDDHGNPIPAAGDHATQDTLVEVAELRAHNTRSGRHYLFDVTFYAVVKSDHVEDVQAKIEAYKPLIQDRARTIIGSVDPDKLTGSEPGLESLRRQMLHELEGVVGPGVVKEVVVPRCVPFRIDY